VVFTGSAGRWAKLLKRRGINASVAMEFPTDEWEGVSYPLLFPPSALPHFYGDPGYGLWKTVELKVLVGEF